MISQFLQNMLKILIVIGVAAIAIVVCLGVFFRYFLDTPLSWTDEVSRYTLVWITFLGGAFLTSQRNGHVNVDFFVDLLKPKSQHVVLVISTLLEISVVLLLTIGGIILVRASQNVTSPALAIPMSFVYSVIPVFGVLSLWFIGVRIIKMRRADREAD